MNLSSLPTLRTAARTRTCTRTLVRALAVTLPAAALVSATSALAQAPLYTVVDLSPSAGNAAANGVEAGYAAGFTASGIYGTATRATAWTADTTVDLHPAFLVDPATGVPGRSSVLDATGAFQVGSGAGTPTGGRTVPIVWSGNAGSARVLTIPFSNLGGQAHGTDGVQIVGQAYPVDAESGLSGASHALVWDAASGAVTDLGDGGKGAMAYGVGGGQQVGYVIKAQASAALWRGTDRSLVVLHPRGAVVSVANDTDGTRQVGYAGYDIRVRAEAAKGNKDARFNYATVWTGTAASALNIHPYPVNAAPGVVLNQSYALATRGGWIAGYAGETAKTGTPAYAHAIVWDADFQSVDLNAFLPAGFVGATAEGVDDAGNVSGYISKADGTRHAAVWIRQAAN